MKKLTVQSLGRVAAMALVSAAALSLVACSSSPSKPQPAPLLPVTNLLHANQAWVAQVGVTPALMTPAVDRGQVVVASQAGTVTAFEAANGRSLWRADVGSPIAVGVGFDGDTAAVVTQDNQLVAVSGGKVTWRVRLPARVFTAPLVAGRRVFVLAGDRSIAAFDANNGAKLWSQPARGTEALVLQQSGVLMAVGNNLVAGIAGRLTGLSPDNGSTRWETVIANPRGVNEIERLVDIVAGVGRVGDQLCVRAFQSAVGCVDAARGQLVWSKSANGGVGVAADADAVYGVENNGRVQAWRRRDGESQWNTDVLLHRGLTAPLAAGRSVAVGDSAGFVHLLSRENGSVLNRLSTDGSAIVAAPALAGQTLVAVTRNGGVYAWRPE